MRILPVGKANLVLGEIVQWHVRDDIYAGVRDASTCAVLQAHRPPGRATLQPHPPDLRDEAAEPGLPGLTDARSGHRQRAAHRGLGGRPAGGVAVQNGRIAAIGDDLGPARERVDAQGLALAPGIVDIHTHYDAQLTWDPFATPSRALGVTTVVIGNCGFTIAPCRPADRDLTLRNLTHVEGMSLDALRAGVDWDFETYPEFLDALERQGMVPNVGLVRRPLLGADVRARRRCHAARRDRRRDRPDARGSCSRRCTPARSASPPPRSSSTTARTASRCLRAWPTSARCSR